MLAGEAHSGGDYSEDESEDGRTTFIEHDVAVSQAPKRLKHKHRIPAQSGKENSGRGKQLPIMPRKSEAEKQLEKIQAENRELKRQMSERENEDREQCRKQR